MNDLLINNDLNFFIYNKDGYQLILNANIFKLFIDKNNKGRMILSVLTKDEIELMDGRWKIIDIVYKDDDGYREDYWNSRLFARFSNCEIKQRWIKDLTISDPTNKDIVRCYYYIKFDIDTINWDVTSEN